jgi:hypothetical protein
MTAPHTGDLDHALADALHAATPHFDEVAVKVLERAAFTNVPTMYRVIGWRGGVRFSGRSAIATEALATAMTRLRAAMGGAL